jgi:arsenate reductase
MTSAEKTVVFVCLHGAAKSVIAAAELERQARARGVAVRAVALGTEPDPEVAPGAAAGLLAAGIDVRGLRPRRVTREDLAQAWKVVSFGPDLANLLPAGQTALRWDDVPAVSDGFAAAHAAITRRLTEVWS